MVKILSIINASLFIILLNNLSAANSTPQNYSYIPDNECTIGTFFRNIFGEGDTKFSDLTTKHDLGDPLVFRKETLHKTLSSKIDILDRETFTNFATDATALVLPQADQNNITDYPYFSSPYTYAITLRACSVVPIAKRSEFIQHLQKEFQPGFYSAGKAYMAQALAHANHMSETIEHAKAFFETDTSSYDRSLIWSGLGKCETIDDIADVTKLFSNLYKGLPSSMSFTHQKDILLILTNKNKTERNDFVKTIQPLTNLLTPNGIGWSVSKFSALSTEELSEKVVTLISYVSEQKPDEREYLTHIGVFRSYR